MNTKKLYLIVVFVLFYIQAFPNANIYTFSTGTWTLLILFAVILIVTIAYLFIHAYIEYYLRDKEISKHLDPKGNAISNEETAENEPKNNKVSEELINLFMLKRKGVISEQEYHQLKSRLFKKRTV
jgi:K+ transporter